MAESNKIAVWSPDEASDSILRPLAQKLSLPFFSRDLPPTPVYLTIEQDHLGLCSTEQRQMKLVSVDFSTADLQMRVVQESRGPSMLRKALGIHSQSKSASRSAAPLIHTPFQQPSPTPQPLSVLDATAGFGVDSFLMASWGCQVLALEQSSILFALLEDGWRRWINMHPTNTLNLVWKLGDAVEYLGALNLSSPTQVCPFDIIYLDPMFPAKKKSAASHKGMQMLQQLLTIPLDMPFEPISRHKNDQTNHSKKRLLIADQDKLERLMKLALKSARQRVVIKRPLRDSTAEQWYPRAPTFSIKGKSTRFDVFVTLSSS